MKSVLPISSSLSLPLDAVTQKLAFLGRTGSGKSYAATKLCELMLEHDAQVIALDPVGVWYGLRVGGNFSIPVFGGLHGDIPLEPGGGKIMADLVVTRGICAVLDVSQLLPSEQARFAYDFAAQFFHRKKAAPSPVHLFVEECQEFVPQNIGKGGGGFEAKMLGAFERLIKLGRNFGIGASLISQRPQEVNKKALNQTECLFAFQMTGPQERKAIESWIHEKGADEDIVSILPKLEIGEAHVWSPQWLKVSETIRFAKKRTADVSSTPAAGGRQKQAKLSPVDLEQLGAEMAATIERAKAEDPAELRKEIAKLRGELRKSEAGSRRPEVQTKIKEVPVLRRDERATLERFTAALEKFNGIDAVGVLAAVGNATARLLIPQRLQDAGAPRVSQAAGQHQGPAPRPMRMPSEGAAPANGGPLPQGEMRVLTAIAQHEDGVTREQLTILTGYKRSSRDTYLQKLRARGFIEICGDAITASSEGSSALPADFEPLPTGQALVEHWRSRLPQGELRIFEIVIAAYPNPVDREAISEATAYKRSSRDTYLQKLTARKLIEPVGRGQVRAASHFFS